MACSREILRGCSVSVPPLSGTGVCRKTQYRNVLSEIVKRSIVTRVEASDGKVLLKNVADDYSTDHASERVRTPYPHLLTCGVCPWTIFGHSSVKLVVRRCGA